MTRGEHGAVVDESLTAEPAQHGRGVEQPLHATAGAQHAERVVLGERVDLDAVDRTEVRRPHPGALCTFEAAARVVELLHGPEAAAPMTAFFAELSARMLAMRGRLPNSDDE